MTTPIATQLTMLFEAERNVRRLHSALARPGRDMGVLVPTLQKELNASFAMGEGEESTLRLVRIAKLLGELEGADVVDMLIDILDGDDPEARTEAGEQLEGLAYDRFKEVALGVGRALQRLEPGSPALSELPYLLAEIPEPGAAKLLGMFLEHADGEAVAAGIEALVEIGDPTARKMLSHLLKDERTVQLEDEGGEEGRVSIGELAKEAIDLLGDIARSSGPEDAR
jgi:HEAT repeat protein